MTASPNPHPDIHNPQLNPPLRSPAALSRFLLVTVVGLALDLWTKVWAFGALVYNQTVVPHPSGVGEFIRVDSRTYEFIPGWLHFRCTANEGAVFGIGQGNRWLFVIVSVLAIAFLTYLFATSGRQRFYQVVLGLLLAGVLGNMYDRICYGFVRDMIYVFPDRHWPAWIKVGLPKHWSWPRGEVFPWIFNVADTLLCTGVGLMLVYSLFAEHARQTGPDDRPGDLRTTTES